VKVPGEDDPARVLRESRGPVVVLRLARPPVNALSPALALALGQALQELAEQQDCRAIVVAAQGRCFSAGADIHAFGAPAGDPHALAGLIETHAKPVVAALHGDTLGAGLELGLACRARVARQDTRLGLPEITLGLIPGAGGTQRLPRLVGADAARAMMLSGQALDARQALAVGLVDEVTTGDPVDAACALALRLASGPWQRPPPRGTPPGQPLPAPRGRLPQPAAQVLEACLSAARELPLSEGLAVEARGFVQCLHAPESRALRHAFAAERRARQVPDLPAGLQARTPERATVVGAGTMGHGIAICLASAGISVDLVDPDDAARDRALRAIAHHHAHQVARGRLQPQEAQARISRVQPHAQLACAAEADLVVEAVYESMALKRALFEELDRVCRPGALLATNTSTLDVDRIATATRRPADVLGLHFFSPAPAMRLLEVVRGAQTSPQALLDGLTLARRLGKVAVVARVGPGFIGNRMVGPYARQAERLLLEGATPQQVDRALVAFGFPMGPLAVGDLVGLDVGVRAAAEAGAAGDPRDGAVARRLVALGRLGQKTGAGLYRYEAGSREPLADPQVEAILREEARRLGVRPRAIDDREIVLRCLLALVNEGAALLGEGIAARAGDIDAVWIHGYGVPRWRGGPMHHADTLGLAQVVEGLAHCSSRSPDDAAGWEPAPLLRELARSGRSFADWDAGRA
jgi:3-hydroxyacyl-CoA dehydrogenase